MITTSSMTEWNLWSGRQSTRDFHEWLVIMIIAYGIDQSSNDCVVKIANFVLIFMGKWIEKKIFLLSQKLFIIFRSTHSCTPQQHPIQSSRKSSHPRSRSMLRSIALVIFAYYSTLEPSRWRSWATTIPIRIKASTKIERANERIYNTI